jgi:hypothetical protein
MFKYVNVLLLIVLNACIWVLTIMSEVLLWLTVIYINK